MKRIICFSLFLLSFSLNSEAVPRKKIERKVDQARCCDLCEDSCVDSCCERACSVNVVNNLTSGGSSTEPSSVTCSTGTVETKIDALSADLDACCNLLSSKVDAIQCSGGTVDVSAILEDTSDMQTRVVDIDTKVDEIAVRMPIIESKVDAIQCSGGTVDVSAILEDTSDIQTRVVDIDTKVDEIAVRMPIIESKVDAIQCSGGTVDVSAILEDTSDTQTRVVDIDTKVDDIAVRMPIIESKVDVVSGNVLGVGNKLDVLTESHLEHVSQNMAAIGEVSDDLLGTMTTLKKLSVDIHDNFDDIDTAISSVSTVMGSKSDVIIGNLATVDGKVDIVTTAVNVVDGKVDTVNASVGVVGTDVTAVLADTSDMQTRVVDIDTKVDDIAVRMPIIESKVDAIQCSGGTVDVSAILEDTSDMQPRVVDINTKIDDMVTRIPGLDTKLVTVTNNISTVDGKIDTLTTTANTIDGKVDTVNTSVGVVGTDVTAVLADTSDMQPRVVDIDTKVDDMVTRIPVLDNKLVTVTNNISTVDGKIDTLTTTANTIDSKVDTVNVNLHAVLIDTADMQPRVVNTETNVNAVLIDTADMQPRVVNTETNVNAVLVDTADMQPRVIDIQTKIDALSAGTSECICCPVGVNQTYIDINQSGGYCTLNTPGQVYCLGEDVTGNISLDATNVTLDLNDHQVTGVIRTQAGNATIRNGTVAPAANSGVLGAITLKTGYNTVENCTVICPTEVSTSFGGLAGIYGDGNASNLTISNCKALGGNGTDSPGVAGQGGNGGAGIRCDGVRVIIENSEAHGGMGGDGTAAFDGQQLSYLSPGYGGSGIYVRNAGESTINNCLATGGDAGRFPDTGMYANFVVFGGHGIYLYGSHSIAIKNCIIPRTGKAVHVLSSFYYGKGGDGVKIEASSIILVDSCRIMNTGTGGTGFDEVNYGGGEGGNGISIHNTNQHSIDIQNCLIEVTGMSDSESSADHCYGGDGIYVAGTPYLINIHDCTILNTGIGGGVLGGAAGYAINAPGVTLSFIYSNVANSTHGYNLPLLSIVGLPEGTAHSLSNNRLENVYIHNK